MAELVLKSIRKSYGAVEVLHGIDLDIVSGEFVVFVGPSGCGKSTLLRVIAGLEEISGGTLEISGRPANRLPPGERGIAMVFQSYALYPHMTVYGNMEFGLKLMKMPKAARDARVRKAADILQLTPYLDRLPKALSGGQRQRVAIGRAITRDPKVFLFDEPLSNLDAALRVQTRIEIANLKEMMPGTTMIYVTHDQVEAMTLADRIVVLNAGRIEQVGTPLELYHAPRTRFVAGFIGSPAMNFLPVEPDGKGSLKLKSGEPLGLSGALPFDWTDVAEIGIRPEHLGLARGDVPAVTGTVLASEELGEVTIVHLDVAGTTIVAKLDGDTAARRGDRMRLSFAPERLHAFAADGQAKARRSTDSAPPRRMAV